MVVDGVVELLPNGSGFVRLSPPEPSDADVYISAAQVKRCELVNGDRVTGPRRAPHRSERFPSLVRIDTVNGRPAEELADRGRFDDLPAVFPTERFKLGSNDATLKAVEFLTPFGRGSRVTISGRSWAGKSHLLRELASILAGQRDVTVFVALAGVRPEELPEWGEAPVRPGAAVTFSASAEAQDNAVELVVDQARRLAARGSDAVVLIDTLDGLHPLSARKALASARNLKDGGSLTVIATGSKPLGGETTVIALDATLAMSGRHPALDLALQRDAAPRAAGRRDRREGDRQGARQGGQVARRQRVSTRCCASDGAAPPCTRSPGRGSRGSRRSAPRSSGWGRFRGRGDEQLDSVDRARPDLDLLGRAVLDQLPALDSRDQLGIEPQHAVEPQHVRHEVVGEHRQLREVVEAPRHPHDEGRRRRSAHA